MISWRGKRTDNIATRNLMQTNTGFVVSFDLLVAPDDFFAESLAGPLSLSLLRVVGDLMARVRYTSFKPSMGWS
jgi:hypothetical protein